MYSLCIAIVNSSEINTKFVFLEYGSKVWQYYYTHKYGLRFHAKTRGPWRVESKLVLRTLKLAFLTVFFITTLDFCFYVYFQKFWPGFREILICTNFSTSQCKPDRFRDRFVARSCKNRGIRKSSTKTVSVSKSVKNPASNYRKHVYEMPTMFVISLGGEAISRFFRRSVWKPKNTPGWSADRFELTSRRDAVVA